MHYLGVWNMQHRLKEVNMKRKILKNKMLNGIATQYIYNMDREELLDYAIKSMVSELSNMKLKDLRNLYTLIFEDKETK